MSLMALLIVTGVTGGILTAFLYPRSVVVEVLSINSTNIVNSSYISMQDNQSYDVLLGVEVSIFPPAIDIY